MVRLRIILASQSPRRRELLAKVVQEFEVISSDADETLPDGIAPDEAVKLLAHKKAAEIAARPEHSGDCVIGADTVVVVDGRILGKPADRHEAAAMLRLLSGRGHTVYTGMAVLTPDHPPKLSVTATEVSFFPLSDDEIERYIDSGEPFDKAGGYGVQGSAYFMVKSISGDYYNVVGLPIAILYRQLSEVCVL